MLRLSGLKARHPDKRDGDLPTYHHGAMTARLHRPTRCLVVSLIIFCVVLVLTWVRDTRNSGRYDPRPIIRWKGGQLKSVPEPSYNDIRQWEDNLPQHNLSLPHPEGRNGRYVKFSTQVYGLGWNNVLNELYVVRRLPVSSMLKNFVDVSIGCSVLIWHMIPAVPTCFATVSSP
jgi:hypothetical protein